MLRTLIEFNIRQPTLGFITNVNDEPIFVRFKKDNFSYIKNEPIAIKAHELEDLNLIKKKFNLDDGLILIVRDPIEVMHSCGRHYFYPFQSYLYGYQKLNPRIIISLFLRLFNYQSHKFLNQMFEQYVKNIKYYQRYPNKKVLLKYEDLIEKQNLEVITKFFGLGYDINKWDIENSYEFSKNIFKNSKKFKRNNKNKDLIKNFVLKKIQNSNDEIKSFFKLHYPQLSV